MHRLQVLVKAISPQVWTSGSNLALVRSEAGDQWPSNRPLEPLWQPICRWHRTERCSGSHWPHWKMMKNDMIAKTIQNMSKLTVLVESSGQFFTVCVGRGLFLLWLCHTTCFHNLPLHWQSQSGNYRIQDTVFLSLSITLSAFFPASLVGLHKAALYLPPVKNWGSKCAQLKNDNSLVSKNCERMLMRSKRFWHCLCTTTSATPKPSQKPKFSSWCASGEL